MMNLRRALLLTALAHATLPLRALANPNAAAADTIGRDLRKLFLSTRAADLGLRPDSGTPPVFGAAFDWPVGTQFATIAALTDGSASLYTTGTYNILGGQAHAPVRAAAQQFVQTAAQHLGSLAPLNNHPYPATNRARLFLLTFDGLRGIELTVDDLRPGSGRYAQAFANAQTVLEALRKTV